MTRQTRCASCPRPRSAQLLCIALHGHVKRKCHRHGQSGGFRLLLLHLRRSGEESRHFFRHSLHLMRGTQLGAQLLDVSLQGFASAALTLKVLFDTRDRKRDASACTAATSVRVRCRSSFAFSRSARR
jgi:hypothetical protein